jgi:uncharacterized phiE125 gp8 family phage protein
MALIRTVPPVALPVSLAEIKAQCNLTDNSHDAILMHYVRMATDYVEEVTGLGLITQTWQQSFSAFSPEMILYRRPLRMVGSPLVPAVSINYLDTGSVYSTLTSSAYLVSLGSAQDFPIIQLGYGGVWPDTFISSESVTVTYTVGFGPDWNYVPNMIRGAIMMAAASYFAYREDIVMGTSVSDVLPFASRNLLRPWCPVVVS